jgi:hypothetical protein
VPANRGHMPRGHITPREYITRARTCYADILCDGPMPHGSILCGNTISPGNVFCALACSPRAYLGEHISSQAHPRSPAGNHMLRAVVYAGGIMGDIICGRARPALSRARHTRDPASELAGSIELHIYCATRDGAPGGGSILRVRSVASIYYVVTVRYATLRCAVTYSMHRHVRGVARESHQPRRSSAYI